MSIQKQIEIQASVQQWVDNFIKDYNISATEMSDALTKVLLTLKDKVIVEYLLELSQPQSQPEFDAAGLPEDMFSQALQEEEVDNGGITNND